MYRIDETRHSLQPIMIQLALPLFSRFPLFIHIYTETTKHLIYKQPFNLFQIYYLENLYRNNQTFKLVYETNDTNVVPLLTFDFLIFSIVL